MRQPVPHLDTENVRLIEALSFRLYNADRIIGPMEYNANIYLFKSMSQTSEPLLKEFFLLKFQNIRLFPVEIP